MKFSVLALFLLTLASLSTSAKQVTESVKLQVLGSGGPELDDGRTSTSYLIWQGDEAKILIDLGSGASVAFGQAGAKFENIDAILLTHLHVDHSADLPAFIKGAFFTSRSQDLPIYGPDANHLMPSTGEYVSRLMSEQGAFSYLSNYLVKGKRSAFKINTSNVPLGNNKVSHYRLEGGVKISALSVHHGPIAALAWRVDMGGYRMTFSGDMSGKTQGFSEFAKGSDVLVMHNAIPENAGAVGKNLHMTPTEIGQFAKGAESKKLVISHRMNRTIGKETEIVQQIRQNYQGELLFAEDLDIYKL